MRLWYYRETKLNKAKYLNVSLLIFSILILFITVFLSDIQRTVADSIESVNSQTKNTTSIIESDLPVIEVSSDVLEKFLRSDEIQYLHESENESILSIKSLLVRSQAAPSLWKVQDREIPSFGFSDTPYWLRFSVENNDLKTLNRVLEISYPILDYVSLYAVKDNQIVDSVEFGDMLPFDSREIKHRNFLYSFNLEPKVKLDFYLRVLSDGSIQVPMTIWEQKEFLLQDQRKQLWQGLFYGAMVVMLLYNFFLYISLRERSYLFYVLFVAMSLASQAAVRGDAFQYLWPDSVFWHNKSVAFFTIAIMVTGYSFVMEFLELKEKDPRAYKVLFGIVLITLMMSVSSFFAPYSLVMSSSSYFAFPVIIYALFVSIRLSFKRDRTAQYFTIAWLAFSAGFMAFVLNKTGVVPRTFLTEHGVQIGTVLNVSLLSFALAERIHRMNRNVFKAQEASRVSDKIAQEAQLKALKVQKQANETLEENVKKRTEELQNALNELSELNLKLEELSSVDALTNVKNRGFFETQYDDEWKRASREKASLALLMIDIDFFKKINDQYGHLAGDKCLKVVAETIQNSVKRPIDTLARYGGEEFAVILPGTELEGARYVAEKIRKDIESLKVDFEGKPILLTASIGLAVIIPEDDNDRVLISSADSALYKAKLSGRNRVVIGKGKDEKKGQALKLKD